MTLLDKLIGYASPRAAARRMYYRHAMEFAQRTPVGSRLDRGWPNRIINPKDEESINEDLRAKARDLVDNTPSAEGLVDRLVGRVVGTQLRMVARTASKSWNRKHADAFADWSEFRADVRHLTDFYGLQAAICRAQITDGRCGAILLKSGSLQLIHGPQIAAPVDRATDDRIIDGVELDPFGAPVAFWINSEIDGSGVTSTRVPVRNFIYFPLLKDHWRTSGAPLFKTSFDQLEQVDGIFEAVTTAAQVAAMFSVLVKQGDDEALTGAVAGFDSQGNSAKHMDLEPGTIQHMRPGDEIEQVKPEHPGENLREFLREVLRFASMPFGVPLEALLNDYSDINYSGARSMLLAFDDAAAEYRSRHLYPGLRRIYRWITSKMVKEGLLPERSDVWKHKIIPPRRKWVDPEKESKGDLIARDMLAKSLTETAEERGQTRDELLDECAEDQKAIKARGLKLMHSISTRDDEPAMAAPGSNDAK